MGRVWSAVRAFRGALHHEPDSPKPRPAPWLEKGELPESYGRTKVVAMPVSPYLMHVYWDLRRDQPAGAPASLRFRETGSGASFDVKVDLAAKNWYVHLWSPEKQYTVELLVNPEGIPVPLARSNPVETPRAWPVAEVRERFTRVPPAPVEPAQPRAELIPKAAVPVPGTPLAAPQPPEPVSIAAPAVPPVLTPRPVPAPVNAIEVLRQRLGELYALRRWRPQPRPADASAISSEGPRPHLLDVIEMGGPTDVTSRVESQFSPGLSSILFGLSAAKKPAG
jgi:hypothetical protein